MGIKNDERIPELRLFLRSQRAQLFLLTLSCLFVAAYFEISQLFSGIAPNLDHEVKGLERALFLPTESSTSIAVALFAGILLMKISECEKWLTPPNALRWLGASACSIPGVSLALWSHYTSTPNLLLPSLALTVTGTGLLLCGRQGARILALPVAFLYFGWTMPRVWVNHALYDLQIFAATAATAVLRMLGFEAERAADLILTDDRIFQVIEACAGLRSMDTLIMATLFYVAVDKTSKLRGLILLLLAPFVALALNIVRIVSIILNPFSEISTVHSIQGIMILVAGVLLISTFDATCLARILPRGDQKQTDIGKFGQPKKTDLPIPLLASGMTIAVPLLMLLGIFTIEPWRIPEKTRNPIFLRLPGVVSTYASRTLKADRDFLGAIHTVDQSHRRYMNSAASIDVFIADDDRQHPALTLLSPKTALPGPGWIISNRSPLRIPALGIDGSKLLLESKEGQRVVYHWYWGRKSNLIEGLRNALAIDRGPWRRERDLTVVRLSTSVENYGRAASEARLLRFISVIADTELFPGENAAAGSQNDD